MRPPWLLIDRFGLARVCRSIQLHLRSHRPARMRCSAPFAHASREAHAAQRNVSGI